MCYDFLIVGAGLSGSVLARLLAEANRRVLVVEKRAHIGGNCFDCMDPNGVFIQPYGAHIFHTDDEEVWRYLSRFTPWRSYQHEVLCFVEGRYIPLPFNFHSLDMVFDGKASTLRNLLVQKYGQKNKISLMTLLREKEPLLRELSGFIHEKIFHPYTLKQWGLKPAELAPEVIARVPLYTDYDNRYFTDAHQGVPENGYTAMIEKMLSHPHIDIQVNTPFESVGSFTDGRILLNGRPFGGQLIYTGPADALLGCRFGPLPYRSLRFEFETRPESHFQSKAVINYPSGAGFTRIIEFKHLTGQICPQTTICREYPARYDPQINEPYYPLETDSSARLYASYACASKSYKNVVLAGRLGQFRYYDMDDAVRKSFETAKALLT